MRDGFHTSPAISSIGAGHMGSGARGGSPRRPSGGTGLVGIPTAARQRRRASAASSTVVAAMGDTAGDAPSDADGRLRTAASLPASGGKSDGGATTFTAFLFML